jgi:hypothetical protein
MAGPPPAPGAGAGRGAPVDLRACTRRTPAIIISVVFLRTQLIAATRCPRVRVSKRVVRLTIRENDAIGAPLATDTEQSRGLNCARFERGTKFVAVVTAACP